MKLLKSISQYNQTMLIIDLLACLLGMGLDYWIEGTFTVLSNVFASFFILFLFILIVSIYFEKQIKDHEETMKAYEEER